MRKTIIGAVIALLSLLGALAITQSPASAYPYGGIVTVDSSFPGRPCAIHETIVNYGATLGYQYQTIQLGLPGGGDECHWLPYFYNNQVWVDTSWYVQMNWLWVNNTTGASTVQSSPLRNVPDGNDGIDIYGNSIFNWWSYAGPTNNSQYHWALPNLRVWRCTAPGLYSHPPTSTTNCVISTQSFS